MRIRYLLGISIIIISSCRTLESKQKYFQNHLVEFGKKYNLTVGPPIKDSVIPADYKVPSMAETKRTLREIEAFWALQPDSTASSDKRILTPSADGTAKIILIPYSKKTDSFYYRPAKIEYIKKHHLETEHKHFVYLNK